MARSSRSARGNDGIAGMTRDRPRALILATIILGHTVVIYLLWMRVEEPPEIQETVLLSVPITLLPIPDPEVPVSPQDVVPEPLPRTPRPAEERVANDLPAAIEQILVPSQTAEPVAIQLPDFAGDAEKTARAWADSNADSRGFNPAAPAREPANAPGRNIFRLDTPRRAGYTEMLGPGIERRWSNSRCYRDFGVPPDRVAGTRQDLNPLTCLVGPGSLRDDLFDHLKPDYLQDQR